MTHSPWGCRLRRPRHNRLYSPAKGDHDRLRRRRSGTNFNSQSGRGSSSSSGPGGGLCRTGTTGLSAAVLRGGLCSSGSRQRAGLGCGGPGLPRRARRCQERPRPLRQRCLRARACHGALAGGVQPPHYLLHSQQRHQLGSAGGDGSVSNLLLYGLMGGGEWIFVWGGASRGKGRVRDN